MRKEPGSVLRQVEHIRGHLWHRYSIMVNQGTVAIAKLSKWWPQQLFTLPEHMSASPVFSGVRVTRSLVLYVYFVNRCLSFCIFLLSLCCLFFFDLRIMIIPLVYSNSTGRVNLATNPVISHKWEKDREVSTTSGTYPWSCVTQIFHSD
jgi:hypothetical protein